MKPIQLIFSLFIIFFFIGAPLLKWIREQIEAEKRRRERMERMDSDTTAEASGQTSKEEMAKRRMEELLALIGSRPSSPPPQQPVSEQPTNLSIAERGARDRARAVYEQRAAELRRQRAMAQAPQQLPQQAQIDMQERARLEAARLRAREAVLRQQKANEAARRAKAAAARPAPRHEPVSLTPLEEIPAASLATLAPAPRPRTAPSKRAAPSQRAAPSPTAVAAAQLPAIKGRNLRDIFILREIIDPPVGMRQPDEW